jgi:hypothetical protein
MKIDYYLGLRVALRGKAERLLVERDLPVSAAGRRELLALLGRHLPAGETLPRPDRSDRRAPSPQDSGANQSRIRRCNEVALSHLMRILTPRLVAVLRSRTTLSTKGIGPPLKCRLIPLTPVIACLHRLVRPWRSYEHAPANNGASEAAVSKTRTTPRQRSKASSRRTRELNATSLGKSSLAKKAMSEISGG